MMLVLQCFAWVYRRVRTRDREYIKNCYIFCDRDSEICRAVFSKLSNRLANLAKTAILNIDLKTNFEAWNALQKPIAPDVDLGEVSLDAYKLIATGENRIDANQIGLALGYKPNFLLARKHKILKLLQEEGFDCPLLWLEIPVEGQTPFYARTASIRDFNQIVGKEALVKKNVKAIALLMAFSEIGIEKLVEDALSNRSFDDFWERIEHYRQWNLSDKEFERILAENREEVRALYAGNELVNLSA